MRTVVALMRNATGRIRQCAARLYSKLNTRPALVDLFRCIYESLIEWMI